MFYWMKEYIGLTLRYRLYRKDEENVWLRPYIYHFSKSRQIPSIFPQWWVRVFFFLCTYLYELLCFSICDVLCFSPFQLLSLWCSNCPVVGQVGLFRLAPSLYDMLLVICGSFFAFWYDEVFLGSSYTLPIPDLESICKKAICKKEKKLIANKHIKTVNFTRNKEMKLKAKVRYHLSWFEWVFLKFVCWSSILKYDGAFGRWLGLGEVMRVERSWWD